MPEISDMVLELSDDMLEISAMVLELSGLTCLRYLTWCWSSAE